MIINSSQELEAMESQIFQLLEDAVHVHIVYTEHLHQCSGAESEQVMVFGNKIPGIRVIGIDQSMLEEFLKLDDVVQQQEHYEEGLYIFCPVCGLETE